MSPKSVLFSGLRLAALQSGSWSSQVSLDVSQSGVIVLLGRNSAGKSTLLNTIAGLLPARSGSIMWRGADITSTNALERTNAGIRIALEGRQLFTRLTVRRNLVLGAYNERDSRRVKARMDEVLQIFPELTSRLESEAGVLSGGQQTMVNVGRALMGKPQLLLLDEPALGLSPDATNRLVGALKSVLTEGVTMIIADQTSQFAAQFPDRVAVLASGELVFDGQLTDAQHAGALQGIFG